MTVIYKHSSQSIIYYLSNNLILLRGPESLVWVKVHSRYHGETLGFKKLK